MVFAALGAKVGTGAPKAVYHAVAYGRPQIPRGSPVIAFHVDPAARTA
jgi:hypothetical protein